MNSRSVNKYKVSEWDANGRQNQESGNRKAGQKHLGNVAGKVLGYC